MFNNERDVEIPFVIDFIKTHPDIKSILDVGAHASHRYYAREVRALVDVYHAIEIQEDPETAAIVDEYCIGNVKYFVGEYDLVMAISTIEHAGLSTYTVSNYIQEQIDVFDAMLRLSKKYVLATFPYGKDATHERDWANITLGQLGQFCGQLDKFATEFWFSEGAQLHHPWKRICPDEASQVGYIPSLGTRCVCFLTGQINKESQ